MKRLSLAVMIVICLFVPTAHAEYTHSLSSGSSNLTCTNTGGSVGSQYSTDIFVGTLSSDSTPKLPAAASNCNPRDHVEIFATQGTNQSYTLATQAGTGTALAVPSSGGSTLTMLPSTGGATDVVLHQIWIYNATPSTPEWELVTQETNPATVLVAGASAGPGVQISGTQIGTTNVPTGVINVKTDEGAKGNGNPHFDGAMTASSATLTSASNPWVSGDVGKLICVAKSNSGNGQTCGTISSYTSAGQVGLSFTNTSGGSITSAWFDFWSDDLNAFNNGCTALRALGGGTLYVPVGDYGLSGEWNCGGDYTVKILGGGAALSNWGYSNACPGGGLCGQTVNNPRVSTYIVSASTTLSSPFLNVNRDVSGGNNGVNTNVYRTDISDLSIWGGVGVTQDGGGQDGIKFTDSPWVTMTRTFVGNFKSYNIEAIAGQGYLDGISLYNVWSLLSGASGFTVSGETQNVTIQDSQFDNNKQYGLYLNAVIWLLSMHNINVQRNNTSNLVSTYQQIGINQNILGCDIAGMYFEDDIGDTPPASNSSHWSLCEWDGGASYGNAGSGLGVGTFQPFFSGSGATALNTCAISVGYQSHIRQCVSDASSCSNGTTYSSGAGSTSCWAQCNTSGVWKLTGEGCY